MREDCSPSKCGCCECQCEEDEIIEHIDDLIEEYTMLIEETGGCTDCIKRVLSEMFFDVLENFRIEE